MTRIRKVLCIGDSLALPGHLNKYEDTWIYKIKNSITEVDFITFFKRQLTTDCLVTMGGGKDGIDNAPKGADCLEFYLPDYIILQLGIVDCAPRLIKNNERKVLEKLPFFLSHTYIKIIKKIRNRKITNTHVTPEKFKKNLENYLTRCINNKVKKVIIVQIPYPDERLISKNRLITANIEQYNSILFELQKVFNKSNLDFIQIVDPLNSRKYSFRIFEDGYHPNRTGHTFIAENIKELLTY